MVKTIDPVSGIDGWCMQSVWGTQNPTPMTSFESRLVLPTRFPVGGCFRVLAVEALIRELVSRFQRGECVGLFSGDCAGRARPFMQFPRET